MIAIDNTLISDDIFTEPFCCDLSLCKGACCVDGDAGAPLNEEEISILEDCIEEIFPFMSEEGKAVVAAKGVFECDSFDDYTTPLINNSECAYLVFEEDKPAGCAIEYAFAQGKIDFRKPISCHLYPIRISRMGTDDVLNYHRWQICKCAIKKGEAENIKIYEFQKNALIRKFGEEWYEKVLAAAKLLKENKYR